MFCAIKHRKWFSVRWTMNGSQPALIHPNCAAVWRMVAITVLSTYFYFDIYWWRTRAPRSQHITRMAHEFRIFYFNFRCRLRVCMWELVSSLAFHDSVFFFPFMLAHSLSAHLFSRLTHLFVQLIRLNWTPMDFAECPMPANKSSVLHALFFLQLLQITSLR